MSHLETFKKALDENPIHREMLIDRFRKIRSESMSICDGLEIEDLIVQPCLEVSPLKWHLAHTTWFFEQLILKKNKKKFVEFSKEFNFIFNSYYKSAGKHWKQKDRGQLSRPTLREVISYREFVNEEMVELIKEEIGDNRDWLFLLEIGLQHEQQHQELMLMDVKFVLNTNPSKPSFHKSDHEKYILTNNEWVSFEEGIYEFGHSGNSFAFDNEGPRHKAYLYPFKISKNEVTNKEFLAFINDGGYERYEFWLSQGWDWKNSNSIVSPLYWESIDGKWFEFTLHGNHPIDLNAPVSHLSYFEADAFASWSNARLPTEYEFEIFDKNYKEKNNTRWCWTKSQYSSYPGFKSFDGMISEYNGKFMCNQFVLKGGCIATPENHYRETYRNFYLPEQRWMFSGIRLVRDLEWK